jgi:DNA-binding beta-propeller fold protein YncE
MSDFITGLRGDLVEAADRHARRGRLRRSRLRLRGWRPQALLPAIAVAATVVAVVVAVRALSPPQTAALRVVVELRVGGQPFDAAGLDGSLFVADFGGRVVRVDTRGRRVAGATPVDGDPVSVAVASDRVLVLAAADGSTPRAQLYTLDRASGRITDTLPLGAAAASEIAVDGSGALWYVPDEHRPAIERLDLTTGRPMVRVPFREAATLVVGGDLVWALGQDGTVIAIDATTAEVVQRLPQVAGTIDVSAPVTNAIAADARGAWVADQRDSRLLRIEAGRVVRRVPLAGEARSVAVAGDELWVGYGDDVRRRYGVARIDPGSGKVLSSFDLGTRDPRALIPEASGVWVVASDGTALLVSS